MPSIRRLSPLRLWQPPRRKFISLSDAAGTGMHSANLLTMPSSNITVAVHAKRVSASDDSDTLWASNAGSYQFQYGANQKTFVAKAPNGRTAVSSALTLGEWNWIVIHYGKEFDDPVDVRIYKDGVAEDTDALGSASTELTTPGRHWFIGDDAPASEPNPLTDAGTRTEIFDFVLFDGIIPIEELNWRDGLWVDISEEARRHVFYRLDGQHSDPGRDSSGNERHFIVESSGVTLSSEDLPPGANIAPLRYIPYIPAPSVSGTTIEPTPATIATAGQAVTVVSTTPLDPALATIALSGQPVTVLSTTPLDPALAAIALSGLPLTMVLEAVLTPETAIIGTVGQPVNVAAELIMPVGPGAIAVAGLPLTVTLGAVLVPALAVIGLTGLPVTMILATDFQPAPAVIGLVGQPVNIGLGVTTFITPGIATIATSGFGVTMVLETVMSIVTGVIATVGRAVAVGLGGVLSPAFGIIAMSGRPVSLIPEIVAGVIHSRRLIIRRRLARRSRR